MAAVDLVATEQGSGPPLSHPAWPVWLRPQLVVAGATARRRRQVFALDARNHGASPWADSMTYADMTADVQAFQAKRRLGRASVIGHSMGGKTAMLLALSMPRRSSGSSSSMSRR